MPLFLYFFFLLQYLHSYNHSLITFPEALLSLQPPVLHCTLRTTLHPSELRCTQAFSACMIWLLPNPLPLSRQQFVFLSQPSCVSPVELTDGRGGWGGANSNNGEKTWPSINHSVLFGINYGLQWISVKHKVQVHVQIRPLLYSFSILYDTKSLFLCFLWHAVYTMRAF